MNAPAVKRKPGRPHVAGESGKRYQVTLDDDTVAALRKSGCGSLSLGIVRAVWRMLSTPADPPGDIQ